MINATGQLPLYSQEISQGHTGFLGLAYINNLVKQLDFKLKLLTGDEYFSFLD